MGVCMYGTVSLIGNGEVVFVMSSPSVPKACKTLCDRRYKGVGAECIKAWKHASFQLVESSMAPNWSMCMTGSSAISFKL